MVRGYLLTCALLALFSAVRPAVGDGAYFFTEDKVGDLAQTRQEVLMVIDSDATAQSKVTYVLRTRYAGTPAALVWVMPVPVTPTGVVAHEDGEVFDLLSEYTRPTFMFRNRYGSGFGCTCSADLGTGAAGNQATGLVEVEAQGEAGIFRWAALTSTGSNALLTWLNDNGFAVPAQAAGVLDGYIQQGMHFLAVRVAEPEGIQPTGEGEIEIPPIQFTCQTLRRFYPMVISQVSAADETEVLIYVLAEHRAEAANGPNAIIDPQTVIYDPTSPSETNYESLFTQAIAEAGGVVLITEFAQANPFTTWGESVPELIAGQEFLTRMRTVIARDDMTLDFEFQDAPSDATVSSFFSVDAASGASAASTIAGPAVVLLLLYSLCRVAVRRSPTWTEAPADTVT